MEQLIDHVKTDTFSIGTFGRSGSRSIVDFLCGYYREMVWPAWRVRYLYDFDTIEESEKDIIIRSYDDPNDKHFIELLRKPLSTHHWHSAEDMSSFNNHNSFLNNVGPKILTLRDPLERAKSGQEKNYHPTFHGAPILNSIDLETVDYILPFDIINEYLLGLNLGSPDDQPFGNMYMKWNLEDYSYDQETDLYNELMEKKEVLPLDLWKSLVRNFNEINIPCKNQSVRYKKKWDL
jgi:hypothetical protein